MEWAARCSCGGREEDYGDTKVPKKNNREATKILVPIWFNGYLISPTKEYPPPPLKNASVNKQGGVGGVPWRALANLEKHSTWPAAGTGA
jgi:hypothetical protein